MKIEFIELNIEWPLELALHDLKSFILSKLKEKGEPLRWAITSVTNYSEKSNQILSVEVVFIIDEDESKGINPVLNWFSCDYS